MILVFKKISHPVALGSLKPTTHHVEWKHPCSGKQRAFYSLCEVEKFIPSLQQSLFPLKQPQGSGC